MALSVDTESDALKSVDRYKLAFPVVYGFDAQEAKERLGAYIDDDKRYIHATGFILRDSRVFHSTYSSGPLGRLQAEHVIGLVDYYQKKG